MLLGRYQVIVAIPALAFCLCAGLESGHLTFGVWLYALAAVCVYYYQLELFCFSHIHTHTYSLSPEIAGVPQKLSIDKTAQHTCNSEYYFTDVQI